MNTGMIAIAVVLFTIIVLPFALIIANTKQQGKQLSKSLLNFAKSNNASLSKQDKHRNYAIGIDEVAKRIFYFRKNSETEITKVVDLNDVSTCTISKQTIKVKVEKGFNEIIEMITLNFQLKDNNNDHFVMYDKNETLQLSDELSVAEDWKKSVDQVLGKIPLL